MITIIAIALTWFATKFYYTRSFRFEIEDNGFIRAVCSRCGKPSYITPDNLRAPYYCTTCG
jgi:hypothetical protein